MKLHLNGVLVVEGKEDASYLSNYISSEIVFINGFELSKKTIDYLKEKHVIALLDPDKSGRLIRKRLNDKLSNIDNPEVDINFCTRGFKTGIAECQIEEIIRVLQPFSAENKENTSEINESDLYRLGLIGRNSALRFYVCEKLNLGTCNGKQLLKRLSLNHISLDTLEITVKGYKE